jgi:hypothetical protein
MMNANTSSPYYRTAKLVSHKSWDHEFTASDENESVIKNPSWRVKPRHRPPRLYRGDFDGF